MQHFNNVDFLFLFFQLRCLFLQSMQTKSWLTYWTRRYLEAKCVEKVHKAFRPLHSLLDSISFCNPAISETIQRIFSFLTKISWNQLYIELLCKLISRNIILVTLYLRYHSVEITEINSNAFLGKISWKKRIY